MEATGPGSKKKKAGGGGFPPVDTSDVKASETADTAMAILVGNLLTRKSRAPASLQREDLKSPAVVHPADQAVPRILNALAARSEMLSKKGAEGVKGVLENLKDTSTANTHLSGKEQLFPAVLRTHRIAPENRSTRPAETSVMKAGERLRTLRTCFPGRT